MPSNLDQQIASNSQQRCCLVWNEIQSETLFSVDIKWDHTLMAGVSIFNPASQMVLIVIWLGIVNTGNYSNSRSEHIFKQKILSPDVGIQSGQWTLSC